MKRPKVTEVTEIEKRIERLRIRRRDAAIPCLNDKPREFCLHATYSVEYEIDWYKDRKWINRCRALYRSWRNSGNSGKDRKFRHSVYAYAWYSWIVTKVYFEWERKEKGLYSEHIR